MSINLLNVQEEDLLAQQLGPAKIYHKMVLYRKYSSTIASLFDLVKSFFRVLRKIGQLHQSWDTETKSLQLYLR